MSLHVFFGKYYSRNYFETPGESFLEVEDTYQMVSIHRRACSLGSTRSTKAREENNQRRRVTPKQYQAEVEISLIQNRKKSAPGQSFNSDDN